MARAESGVMLAGGQGALTGRVLQIGHMGPAAYPMSPVIGLAALGHALRRLGAKADIGAAVEAALAARDDGGESPQRSILPRQNSVGPDNDSGSINMFD